MMLKSEKTDTVKGRQGDAGTRRNALRVSVSPCLRVCSLLLGLLITAGCRQDMQDQPKMKPYRGTTFFADRLSARQPIEGTVPRGFLRTDTEFFTGKKSETATAGHSTDRASKHSNSTARTTRFLTISTTFPIPITEEVVMRGRERYDIFCSACHGLTGNGDGMIVRRGFRRAASFNDDRLRQAPVGHFFDAITNGWGAMPSYASQIPVQDRWAIVAYIRALQESQRNLTTPSASPSPTASPTPTPGGHE